jgi:hypothetical protein
MTVPELTGGSRNKNNVHKRMVKKMVPELAEDGKEFLK